MNIQAFAFYMVKLEIIFIIADGIEILLWLKCTVLLSATHWMEHITHTKHIFYGSIDLSVFILCSVIFPCTLFTWFGF